MAGRDTTNKLFVGGLPKDTTTTQLEEYFLKYGTLNDCIVMTSRETGESRGFGFVNFDSSEAVEEVLANYSDHKLNGKWIEVKRTQPLGEAPRPRGGGSKGGNDFGGGGDQRAGDWQCPGCGVNVFASKSSCFKCGAQKPMGGGGGKGGGYGMPPAMKGGYGGYGAYGDPGAYAGGYGGGAYTMGGKGGYGAPPAYGAYGPAYGAYGDGPGAYGGGYGGGAYTMGGKGGYAPY